MAAALLAYLTECFQFVNVSFANNYLHIIILQLLIYTGITCSSSTAPLNGSVTYDSVVDENGTYPFNVVATYSCNTGFSLVGGSDRTCTGDGSSTTGAFNGMAPICEGMIFYTIENVDDT